MAISTYWYTLTAILHASIFNWRYQTVFRSCFVHSNMLDNKNAKMNKTPVSFRKNLNCPENNTESTGALSNRKNSGQLQLFGHHTLFLNQNT